MKEKNTQKSAAQLRKALAAVQNELKEARKELETQKWGLGKTNQALRSLYKKLEQQNEELLKLDQLKSDFVSTVSHEIRTPLAISTEGINLILDGIAGPTTEKQKNLLETSRENLERLNMIINDLLDISKIESGKIELRPIFIDLTRHLKDVVGSYQPVVAKKKLKLVTNFPSESMMLYVDKDKVTQIVTNLLSNAYKFTPEGGAIEVSLVVQDSEVVCSIKDSGMGIEKEHISKLFKKFQQIGRQEGPGIKGTGLGLAISRSLVELHGGRIWAESKAGEGTIFHFALPLHKQVKDKFHQQFDLLLNDARAQKNNFGFIMLQLKNADEIKVKQGQEALMKIMNQLLSIIYGVLSHPDDKVFLYDEGSIYILLTQTRSQGVRSVIQRIKRNMEKTHLDDKKSGTTLDIKFGHAIFPESDSREKLVKSAAKDISRPKTILVVDDHPQIFRILQSRLVKQGFCVEAAKTGEEALKHVQEKFPDLIILDIMMPEMSGYEVFGRLKEDPQTAALPVIILTAKNIETVRKEAPAAGDIPIITKTGSFQYLIELIHKMI